MTVLVIAAHPDDEAIGCGATIASHARRGDAVYVGVLADGCTSRDGATFSNVMDRWTRWLHALHELGAHPLYPRQALPDQRLDTVGRLTLTKQIEQWLTEVQPGMIYVHSPHDPNADHRMVWEAAEPALLRYQWPKALVCRYGVRTMRPEFKPTFTEPVEPIDEVLRARALACYGDECAKDRPGAERFEEWQPCTSPA